MYHQIFQDNGGCQAVLRMDVLQRKVNRRLCKKIANPMVQPKMLDKSTCARVVPAKPALSNNLVNLFSHLVYPFLAFSTVDTEIKVK